MNNPNGIIGGIKISQRGDNCFRIKHIETNDYLLITDAQMPLMIFILSLLYPKNKIPHEVTYEGKNYEFTGEIRKPLKDEFHIVMYDDYITDDKIENPLIVQHDGIFYDTTYLTNGKTTDYRIIYKIKE